MSDENIHIEDFDENGKLNGNSGEELSTDEHHSSDVIQNQTHLSGMFQTWFLDYASYVILERAVPHVIDGLKPVQRRILHSMRQLDDGRFNKVANIIGHTMQYHPHGDASIGDALVQLGQRELIIDTQGNWGNIFTGDSAAAPRYIEARLSKFANEVIFNPKTTNWKLSYDGRNKEPIALPVKFPLLLLLGVEGIAVGLASKVLPHNFNELIDAAVAFLQGQEFEIYPDFPTGGMIEVTRYNDGLRGGSVKVRAKINKLDKKSLVITDIPFGKTTGGVIESIIKANDRGKIKIKKVDDNTAENVEIVVHLQPGVSPDITLDALYAFTDCEVNISPNSCVIEHDKPHFLGVSEILKISAQNTLNLLKLELEIRLSELEEEWHITSLEKIFFEKKIYRILEKDAESWDVVLELVEKGFDPYLKYLKRAVTRDDVVKLTEKPVRKISKFDIKKADEHISNIEIEMDEVKNHLEHIVDYTVNYFGQIKKKYGTGRERKTEIRSFDTIEATMVVAANERLYVNRKEGFIGTSLRKDEFVSECSDIDDIIIFRRDGKYLVTRVSDKSFVGKDIIHIAIFNKNDERTVFNVAYRDGKNGTVMIKRFSVTSVTRDKEYDVTRGEEGSKILYFSANPNGEAEVVRVYLKPKPKLRKLVFEADFSQIAIKGKNSIGNILSKNEVHKIVLKEQGVSTLGGLKIWFDDTVLRLNSDERGHYLGEFEGDDKIAVIYKSGKYKLTNFDLSNHFEEDICIIERYDPDKVYSLLHFDGEQKFYYLKRFVLEPTEREQTLLTEHPDSKFIMLSQDELPMLQVIFGGKHQKREPETINVAEFIAVKGFKARGKRVTTFETGSFNWLEPLPVPEKETPEDIETIELSEDISESEEKEEIAPKETISITEEKIIEEEPLEIIEDVTEIVEEIISEKSKNEIKTVEEKAQKTSKKTSKTTETKDNTNGSTDPFQMTLDF